MASQRTGTLTRLGFFGVALVAVAAGAAGLGRAVGPDTGKDDNMRGQHPSHGRTDGHSAPVTSRPKGASGLAVAHDGYRLVFAGTTLARGKTEDVRFTILDRDAEPVRDFDQEGGVRMHLIVVRRDLTGYQHVHPKLAADGSWQTRLTLREAGVYRAFADFETGGEKIVLADDLFVGGEFVPARLPEPARRDDVDGYSVTLAGGARAGHEAELAFRVARAGKAVDLEPYLGARGHLVALRAGDLAYLHVHPLAGGAPGQVRFAAEFPSPGFYRLFLQFDAGGAVHTAAFTLEVAR